MESISLITYKSINSGILVRYIHLTGAAHRKGGKDYKNKRQRL